MRGTIHYWRSRNQIVSMFVMFILLAGGLTSAVSTTVEAAPAGVQKDDANSKVARAALNWSRYGVVFAGATNQRSSTRRKRWAPR